MAGNLLKKTHNGARAVVECAMGMLDMLQEINASHGSKLSLEQTMGVNTGSVVAGVCGCVSGGGRGGGHLERAK